MNFFLFCCFTVALFCGAGFFFFLGKCFEGDKQKEKFEKLTKDLDRSTNELEAAVKKNAPPKI